MKTSTKPTRLALLGSGAALILFAFTAFALPVDSGASPAFDGPASSGPSAGLDIAGSREQEAPARTAEQVRGVYTAACGTRFSFDFEGQALYSFTGKAPDESLGAHSQTGQGLDLTCRAKLDMTIAERTADTIVVWLRFGNVELSSGGRKAERRETDWKSFDLALASDVFVRLDLCGAILGYGFAAGIDGGGRNLLRGLIAPLFVAVPHDAPTTWEASASDATGVYNARFQARATEAGLPVRRSKLAYTEVAGQGETRPSSKVEGHGDFELARELGWLHSVRFDETCVLELSELGVDVRLRQRGSLQWVATEAQVATMPALPELASWAAAAGHLEDSGEDASRSIDAARDAAAAKLDPEALLRDLAALLRADPVDRKAVHEVWSKLVDRLRIDPAKIDELALRIEGGAVEEDLATAILTAIGATNTERAQVALDAVRTSERVAPALREAAAVAMLQLASPSPALLASLVQGLDRASDFSGLTGNDLHLLGALCSRSQGMLPDGRSAFAYLQGLEARAKAQGQVGTWIEAVANSNKPEALDVCARYASHQDTDLRRRAFAGLRGIDETRATNTLVDKGLRDDDAAVRAEAALALGAHSGERVTNALVQVARGDQDPGTRLAALNALASRPLSASVRDSLRDLATLDQDDHVRQMANEILRRQRR